MAGCKVRGCGRLEQVMYVRRKSGTGLGTRYQTLCKTHVNAWDRKHPKRKEKARGSR